MVSDLTVSVASSVGLRTGEEKEKEGPLVALVCISTIQVSALFTPMLFRFTYQV